MVRMTGYLVRSGSEIGVLGVSSTVSSIAVCVYEFADVLRNVVAL